MNSATDAAVYKLQQINPSTVHNLVSPLFIRGEDVLSTYRTFEGYVIFTNKRIVLITLENESHTKSHYKTMPYSKIIDFSIESSGILESFSDLNINFINNEVRFEFEGNSNIVKICHTITSFITQ